jgi:hypothetical protein
MSKAIKRMACFIFLKTREGWIRRQMPKRTKEEKPVVFYGTLFA